jgi:predicted ribosome quality control (RQC) complex YloA/Tae2 family protein
VHNNYYLFRQVCISLATRLKDSVISECFSQSKEELIIRFETHTGSFYIKVSVLSSFSYVAFPEEFHRARKNSVDLFPEIVGRRVKRVREFNNERCLAIELNDDYTLLFKMHGNRSNIIVFKNDSVYQLFKKNLKADTNLKLDSLDREIDWSYEAFLQYHDKPHQLYFTFGKVVREYLQHKHYDSMPVEQKWTLIQGVRSQLENPKFYIISLHGVPTLSLIPGEETLKHFADPLKALNEFSSTYAYHLAFTTEKRALLNELQERIKSGHNYILKNQGKLNEVRADSHFKVYADLIMANMHHIPTGAESVTVANFYDNNNHIEIPLKKDFTAQKNAEVYYRKAKNQAVEIEHLEKTIATKKKELDDLAKDLQLINTAEDIKSIRAIREHLGAYQPTAKSESLPYHEFEWLGYKIWVGKNAVSNDVLTQKYSYKEDLFLHAKDVPGSHVLIKHQAGKNFPKDVIEFAAQIAAYNSKRKNETLCPVIVTPKKFVRKRKGDRAGAVVIEREEVILVEPKLPLNQAALD